jgi:hypothetical protein
MTRGIADLVNTIREEFGMIGKCTSAWSAVLVRRGSTTTTLPPRARIASTRPGKSGAVHNDPFDSHGLAPKIMR